MKNYFLILVFIFLQHCSFDDKSGIWNNSSDISRNKSIFKEFKKLSSTQQQFNETIIFDEKISLNFLVKKQVKEIKTKMGRKKKKKTKQVKIKKKKILTKKPITQNAYKANVYKTNEEKIKIKKILKQPTEKKSYNVKDYVVPTYLGHGLNDNVVDVQETQLFHKVLLSNHSNISVKLHIDSTAKHNYMYWDSEVDEVLNFFNSTVVK